MSVYCLTSDLTSRCNLARLVPKADICHSCRTREVDDALPDHESFVVRSHHHGSFGGGQAQSRLWCANCLATSYVNSRHDLAMARHGRQWADSGSFGRNVLACVADPTDVSRATRDAEKWLCVLDRTCDLMRSDRGSLLGSFLALGLGSRERRAFCR